MSEARGPLVADFHRFYGRSLATIRDSGIPLREVADMAAHLPLESATRRALDPNWERTPEVDFLREIEHDLRIVAWQSTKDASRGRGYPDPIRLPWDPAPEGSLRGDRMTTEDWDVHLGWDKLKAGQPSEEV